ncbi:MAG: hypothetical protein E7319_07565 [Clostridiales bacterium]|nr:hypothetical protein [Clostridiales bacterium]
MRIDLTCPVELWQYAMPQENTSECTFVMNNLSSKVVTSVMVTLNCYNKQDQLLFRQSERVQGLNAGVGERFSLVILPSQWEGVEGMDLVVEKVWFDDASVWRRGNAPLTTYTPNALSNGRALDHLRFVAGRDAMGYPQVQQEAWVCVCGRANALDSDRCCRCERGRETVFASYNRENVEAIIAVHERKLSDDSRRAREDNSRLNEEESKRRSAKKRKQKSFARIAITAVCVLAVAAVAVFWGVPTISYHNANQLMGSGQYEKAQAAFAGMGDYRDAAEKARLCDYQYAVSLAEAGDRESLEKAGAIFESLDGYEDSTERYQKARYALGELYYQDGLYDQAADRFQSLGEYEDSADKLKQCVYAQADELFSNGQISLAQALFATIADYSDAADRVRGCQYAQAKLSEEAGDDESAAQLYLQAGEYEDAPERRAACLYRVAGQTRENGDLEKAGSLYLSCGEYEDAQEKGKECLYLYGVEQEEAGNYEAAAQTFRRIPDYQDTQERLTICMYQQAESAREQGDYASAVLLYRSINGYGDSLECIDECNYLMAVQAIENGDFAAAETLLSSLEAEGEPSAQLISVRYQLAEKAFDQKDYQKALDYYLLLNDEETYGKRIQDCYFELGNQQMEVGLYEDAMDSFAAAGDREGSQEARENAAIKLVELCQSNNDLEGVRALLVREDVPQAARDRALEALLAEGKRLEDAGEYDAAAEWYASLGEQDAALERYRASRYQAALKLMQNGEYQAAAEGFLAAGDYQDAELQAQSCFDSLYGGLLAQAKNTQEAKDYLGTIALLHPVISQGNLPESYEELHQLYQEACLTHADELYRTDRRYEALPFYLAVADAPAAQEKLSRRAYLILGTWESNSGRTAIFRADGTCNLMGKEGYFKVDNFSLLTGEEPDELTVTHRINSMTSKGMSIEELRGKTEVNYKLDKVAEAEIPPMNLDGIQAEEPVVEDGNEP